MKTHDPPTDVHPKSRGSAPDTPPEAFGWLNEFSGDPLTDVEAARAAQEAGARHLVLYHLVPPLPVPLIEAAFVGDARSHFDGPITVGRDGMLFSLPAGSDRIIKRTTF